MNLPFPACMQGLLSGGYYSIHKKGLISKQKKPSPFSNGDGIYIGISEIFSFYDDLTDTVVAADRP